MTARIYKPARSATQSGYAKTREWVLEFPASERRVKDPLMGWTGSRDTQEQVEMRFDTAEAAKDYAERHGLAYTVEAAQTRKPVIRPGGYGDNFSHRRRGAWTH